MELYKDLYLYLCYLGSTANIFAKSFQNIIFFFRESVANKLTQLNAQPESQNLSFINNHLVYSNFVYPLLGDKLVFNLSLDLSEMGSFSLSL